MNINAGGHGMQHDDTAQNYLTIPMPDLTPAPKIRQPWARLLKAVLDLAGDHAEFVSHSERDWSTATFSGSRHTLTLCFAGQAAAESGESFILALSDHEFTLPRHLVADAQVIAVDDRQLPERKLLVEVELLLIDRA